MLTIPKSAEVTSQLRRYRYQAGVSGQEAASVINKKPTTLYKYESGRLKISQHDMIELLLYYRVDLDTAFSDFRDAGVGGRKKNNAARHLREIEDIYNGLPEQGQKHLYLAAKQAQAYYAEGRTLKP